KKIKVDNYPTYNAVFRSYMYSADHPALTGHDLTPGNTMTGQVPNYYKPEDLTSIKESKPYVQTNDILGQNYPNPFSYNTSMDFEITESKRINMTVFDFSGNYIKTLVDADYSKGKYTTTWNGTNEGGKQVAGGIYFYVLKADNRQLSKKMILVK
ncbi:MAG: T9SS type A sorting domain-containing protein, partial [Bacteroidota bacterium]